MIIVDHPLPVLCFMIAKIDYCLYCGPAWDLPITYDRDCFQIEHSSICAGIPE